MRTRILAVAASLFQAQGYEGTSIASIAKKVDVTPAALYWYFASKDDILAEVLENVVRRFLANSRWALEVPTPEEQLYRAIWSHVQIQLAKTEPYIATTYAFSQLVRQLPERQQNGIFILEREYFDTIEQILIAGQTDGLFSFENLAATAFAILNIAEYVITWYDPNGRLTPDYIADYYARLGLRVAGLSEYKSSNLYGVISPESTDGSR